MKRKFLFLMLSIVLPLSAHAGGLMTNTNYHIAFDRMMARGASMEIDAAYSNPAGLAWTSEGWQLSLNFQKPWQHRDITTTVGGITQSFEGVASAPIVPALFATYKKDRIVFSTMIGIVGSGGFVEYDNGVPMFNIPIAAMIASQGVPDVGYTMDSQMKGKQYIYGGQLNLTYKATDNMSAAIGLRANYYDGYYRGHVVATTVPSYGSIPLVNLQLDCIQRGWGFTPIVAVGYHEGPLTIAARYEFRTKIQTTNDTQTLQINGTDVKQMAEKMGNEATIQALAATPMGSMTSKVSGYLPDAKTRYDMPSLLSVAVGYEFTPQLRATAEYHFFDDKHAKMAGDRQKELTHGTHEFLLGAEYDINKRFTVSCGAQRTDYGLSDSYQQNTSFACDSWSVGLGGAVNLTEKLRLNAGYFITLYTDYTKQAVAGRDGYSGTDVYSRTNNVIGIGLDYKF